MYQSIVDDTISGIDARLPKNVRKLAIIDVILLLVSVIDFVREQPVQKFAKGIYICARLRMLQVPVAELRRAEPASCCDLPSFCQRLCVKAKAESTISYDRAVAVQKYVSGL